MSLFSILRKNISIEKRNKFRSYLPDFTLKKASYSQSGEDLIVNFLLNFVKNSTPIKYLDIGANHPFHLSNTAFFYKKGGSGVLVEPDPYLSNLLRKKRPRDKVIECGVHFSGKKSAVFFIMDSPTLNTFCEQEMLRYVDMGHKLISKKHVNLIDVNSILGTIGELDFLNIDIEGLDYAILERINWSKFRPKCICVETITYEINKKPKKLENILKLMDSLGYVLYADTFINSIFIDGAVWNKYWILKNKK